MKKKSFLQKVRDLVSAMGFSVKLSPPQPRIEKTRMESAKRTRKGKNNMSKVRRTSHK